MGLVPYNLSPIQQGIQFGHAVVEFALRYGQRPDYNEWANNHKTFIILNGGTTNNHPSTPGTMQTALAELESRGIRRETFHEPDLNDALTAIVFLVDDRVYDPSVVGEFPWKADAEGMPFSVVDLLDPTWRIDNFTPHMQQKYDEWQNNMGGSRNVFLRYFLKQFRLA